MAGTPQDELLAKSWTFDGTSSVGHLHLQMLCFSCGSVMFRPSVRFFCGVFFTNHRRLSWLVYDWLPPILYFTIVGRSHNLSMTVGYMSITIDCLYLSHHCCSLSLSIRKNSMIDHAWSLFRNYFRMEHNKCAMTFKQMYPSLYWLVYSGPHQRLWVLPTNKPGRIPSGNQMWQWKIPYKEVKKREHHLLNKASMTPEIHDKQHIYPVLLQATSEYSKVAMRFF